MLKAVADFEWDTAEFTRLCQLVGRRNEGRHGRYAPGELVLIKVEGTRNGTLSDGKETWEGASVEAHFHAVDPNRQVNDGRFYPFASFAGLPVPE